MSLVQGNFGFFFGNFELVAQEGNQLVHYWRNNSDVPLPWHLGAQFGGPVDSMPALIRSNFGTQGNFELVVREGHQLRHYWRDNDDPNFPWQKGASFGNNVTSAPALIQSSLGAQGDFQVVVREGNSLRRYWRENDSPPLIWQAGEQFGNAVDSGPALIESTVDGQNHFEVVAQEGNRLRHYRREILEPHWNEGPLFAYSVSSAPALIQSNLGTQGNLEVIYNEDGRLRRYYRDHDVPGHPWKKDDFWGGGRKITGRPFLIQSTFGVVGNFEAIAKSGNCWVHFWLNNDSTGNAWSNERHLHAVPPAGKLPTAQELDFFHNELRFPYLRNWTITEPPSSVYNCFAWSVGVTKKKIVPGDYVSHFDPFYKSYGWIPTQESRREYRKRKIALYADGHSPQSIVRHASRETYDCDWHESKMGGNHRIIHDKHQLEGGKYGIIVRYYEKPDPQANLDLKP